MKILVVDDEKFIRQGIKYMLEEEIDDIQVVLSSNGLEALDKIDNQKIDIIITDIKMPLMDGIKLISEIRKNNKEIPIYVLTGFNEFEYAQQCIDYKIEKYILKPIEKEEIVELIIDSIKKILKNKEEEKKDIIEEIKYEFLKEEKSNDVILSRLNKIGIRSKEYRFFYFKTDDKVKEENIIEYDDGYLLIASPDYKMEKINYEILLETDISSDIGDLLKQLEIIKNYINIIDKKHISYKMIKNNNLKFYHDEKIIKLLELLKKGEKYLAINLFDDIFSDDKIKKYEWTFYREIYNSMKRIVFDEYTNNGIEYENLNFKNIEEYKNILLNKIMESYDNMGKSNSIEEIYIEKAKKYIAENYRNDLNMAMVSNYVSLNYSYFSFLFKKYVDTSFSDYVNKVRIERAKELLKKVDYKIYDIAEEVGYKNSKYFIKIFKKYEKISPNEYKLKNIERK